MSGEAFGIPQSLARMFRRECTECGSRDLRWSTAVDLLLNAPTPEARTELRDIVRETGGDGDAWLCGACHGYGVFGPMQYEGF